MATTDSNFTDTVIVAAACSLLIIMTIIFTAGEGRTSVFGMAVGDGDTTADMVLGQPDFLAQDHGTSATLFTNPTGIAVDLAGRVFVMDGANHRVLIYNNLADTVADLVIGQSDFTSNPYPAGSVGDSVFNLPTGAAVDSVGRVFVSDYNNNRVLIFNGLADRFADSVLGQPILTANTANNGGISPTSMSNPNYLAIDANGKILVSDVSNHRVLIFNNLADTIADAVLGQPTFTSNAPNNGGVSATSLNSPAGVASDSSGRIYVSDASNHRVLIFNNLADTVADVVLGQPTFTSNTPDNGGVSATSLNNPYGVALDAGGRVIVSDVSNRRVLIFNNLADTTADMVLGQPNFTSGSYVGYSATAFGNNPSGVATDTVGRIYVLDKTVQRVLIFNNPPASMPVATTTTTVTTTVAPSTGGSSPSGGGGACVISRLGLPQYVMAGLRVLRDGVMNCRAGRVVAMLYYAASESATAPW